MAKEYKYRGKVFIEAKETNVCAGCYFLKMGIKLPVGCKLPENCKAIPYCFNIIFIKKPKS